MKTNCETDAVGCGAWAAFLRHFLLRLRRGFGFVAAGLFALFLAASPRANAQSSAYAFTNFVGQPGVAGTNDGVGTQRNSITQPALRWMAVGICSWPTLGTTRFGG